MRASRNGCSLWHNGQRGFIVTAFHNSDNTLSFLIKKERIILLFFVSSSLFGPFYGLSRLWQVINRDFPFQLLELYYNPAHFVRMLKRNVIKMYKSFKSVIPNRGAGYPSVWISSPRKTVAILSGYAFPILNILVPQFGQVPWVAGLPFFMVIALASFISLLARHFIQYACIEFSSFEYIWHKW